MKKAILAIILSLSLMPVMETQAQETNNGGDPNELAEFTGSNGKHLDSWYSVKTDLLRGFLTDKYLELKLGEIDAKQLKKDMVLALQSTKVFFDNKPIVVKSSPKPCENFRRSGMRYIHCNFNVYTAMMKNYTPEEQYKMEAHEYFGVAGDKGYESDVAGISNYPLSSQISYSLQTVSVKKWAITGSNCDLIGKDGGCSPDNVALQCEMSTIKNGVKARSIVTQTTSKGSRILVLSEKGKKNEYAAFPLVAEYFPGQKPHYNHPKLSYYFYQYSAGAVLKYGDSKLMLRLSYHYFPQGLKNNRLPMGTGLTHVFAEIYDTFDHQEKNLGKDWSRQMKCALLPTLNGEYPDYNLQGETISQIALTPGQIEALLRKTFRWLENE